MRLTRPQQGTSAPPPRHEVAESQRMGHVRLRFAGIIVDDGTGKVHLIEDAEEEEEEKEEGKVEEAERT